MSEELDHLIRNRPIRRAVFQAALESGEPFSVAQLAAKCRKMHPPASRATVYRNLRLLLKHGYLRETILRNGLRVYRPATDSRNIVWVCDDCSHVQCLSGEDVLDQLKCLANRNGFHPCDLTLEIHSRCLQMQRNGFCDASR
jgi:Fe2+ or Zn2+ uptake regulation protein